MSHRSAGPSHYDEESATYDAFNEELSKPVNRTLERILRSHKVRTVLDLACGTGSQVFWLARRGFSVAGCDISAAMLEIARRKAKAARSDVTLLRGDMRSVQAGRFDAALTISNAVGHLTRADFEKAMRNIRRNLNPGGLYLFDIYNLSHILHGDNIRRLTIDWLTTRGRSRIREVQHSTINAAGILTSFTTLYEQAGSGIPKVSKSTQTLQIYSAKQLAAMLHRNDFKVVRQCGMDGSKFSERHSERILTIAMRI